MTTTTISHRHEGALSRARRAYVPAPNAPVAYRGRSIPDPQQLAKMIEDAKGNLATPKVSPAPRPKNRPKTLKRKLRDLMQDGRWRCTADVLFRFGGGYSDQTVRDAMKEMTRDGILVSEVSGPNSTLCFRWVGTGRAAQ